MSKNENLLAKINDYFKQAGIATIQPENDELKNLFEASLENIWINVNNSSKRMRVKDELSNYFLPFFGTVNITAFLDEYCSKLDKKYPGESDYEDIYQWCLAEYSRFEAVYLQKNEIDIDKLEKIAEKLILIIHENKNVFISFAGERPGNYSIHSYHEINSTILAISGGMGLNYDKITLKELALASLLHDIGMLNVPGELLKKEDALTEKEFNIIKAHTIEAGSILAGTGISNNVMDGIVQHHEQFDGNGYPRKLKGEQINEYAKIISIADAYESQISKRSYREAKSGYAAMKQVLSEAKNKYDPAILKVFLKTLSIFPPGTLVQLNDDSIGIVIAINNKSPLRPEIKLLINSDGIKLNGKMKINLIDNPELFIVYVLNKSEYRKNQK